MTCLRLGISTCPNDTFAFHGLITRSVDWRGLDFRVELLDIQELNSRLARHELDLAKASFFAAFQQAERYAVLPVGAALGFGVGPLLLAARHAPHPAESRSHSRVLAPGASTTAHLLLRMYYPQWEHIEQVEFSEILPRLIRGEADYGVCIHEGRFTWADRGLRCLEDLGARWERSTGGPLPLGGIVGARSLPSEVMGRALSVIRSSLEYGLQNREAALESMRHWAQELDDRVLWQHVELYVNHWTQELGETGRLALKTMRAEAIRWGLLPPEACELTMIDSLS